MELTVYVVRNQEGKFFRAKGYGGYGNSWVDDIQKAKIYPRIGPARATVTWWSKSQWVPEYGVPEILMIKGTVAEVLKEDDRVQKSKESKQRRQNNAEKQQIQREMDILSNRLSQLRGEKR